MLCWAHSFTRSPVRGRVYHWIKRWLYLLCFLLFWTMVRGETEIQLKQRELRTIDFSFSLSLFQIKNILFGFPLHWFSLSPPIPPPVSARLSIRLRKGQESGGRKRKHGNKQIKIKELARIDILLFVFVENTLKRKFFDLEKKENLPKLLSVIWMITNEKRRMWTAVQIRIPDEWCT